MASAAQELPKIQAIRLPGNKAYDYKKPQVWEKIAAENAALLQSSHIFYITTDSIRAVRYLLECPFIDKDKVELILYSACMTSLDGKDFRMKLTAIEPILKKFLIQIHITASDEYKPNGLLSKMKKITTIKQIDHIPLSQIQVQQLALPEDVKNSAKESKKRKRSADSADSTDSAPNKEPRRESNELQSQCDALQKQNKALQEQNNALQKRNKALQSQAMKLKRQRDKLQMKHDVLQIKSDKSQVKHGELRKQHDELKAQYGASQQQCVKYKEQLTALQSAYRDPQQQRAPIAPEKDYVWSQPNRSTLFSAIITPLVELADTSEQQDLDRMICASRLAALPGSSAKK